MRRSMSQDGQALRQSPIEAPGEGNGTVEALPAPPEVGYAELVDRLRRYEQERREMRARLERILARMEFDRPRER